MWPKDEIFIDKFENDIIYFTRGIRKYKFDWEEITHTDWRDAIWEFTYTSQTLINDNYLYEKNRELETNK